MTNDIDDGDDLPPHLKDAARAYNEPPGAVPREEMWAAIARARSSAAVVSPIDAPRHGHAAGGRRWQWAAAAAVLLLIGYAAGRVQAPAPAAAPADDRRAASLADAIIATRHFARAELVLTQFRNDVASARPDTALARWSQQLLNDTRLLLDSPAAVDPARHAMLEDLELILVQITRGSRLNNASDLQLTSDALRDSGLLNKLRTIVPSGTNPRS
jgi:hypothetical protein